MDVIQDSEYLLKAIERDDRIRAQLQSRAQSAAQKPKPGDLCPADCLADADDCENCMGCQKMLEEYLLQIDQMEQASKSQSGQVTAEPEKSNKCVLCGAPIEAGEKECPYCGTAYEFLKKGHINGPVSKDVFLDELGKAAKCMFFTKVAIMQAEYSGYMDMFVELSQMGFMDALQGRTLLLEGLNLSGGEVYEDADRQGMSCAEYLRALIKGNLVSSRYQRVLQREERNAQIEREKNEKVHEIRKEQIEREGRIRAQSVPKYSGGGGGGGGSRSCCGNCSNYMPQAARCALDPDSPFQVNATGFCGSYRSK